jgi:predicted metal-dependent hydrolase
MKIRKSQLPLRLDAAATPAVNWQDGMRLAYLGGSLRLQLDTDRERAARESEVLHLPLPPEATPRQIQDAAEAWLRREAEQLLQEISGRIAANLHIPAPTLQLSFASRTDWVRRDGHGLRCNWRLIEQPLAVIDQLLLREIGAMAQPSMALDLFAV